MKDFILRWRRLCLGVIIIIGGMIFQRGYYHETRWLEFPYYIATICKWLGFWLAAKPIIRELLDK